MKGAQVIITFILMLLANKVLSAQGAVSESTPPKHFTVMEAYCLYGQSVLQYGAISRIQPGISITPTIIQSITLWGQKIVAIVRLSAYEKERDQQQKSIPIPHRTKSPSMAPSLRKADTG